MTASTFEPSSAVDEVLSNAGPIELREHALTFMQNGEADAALHALRRAHELAPDDPETLQHLYLLENSQGLVASEDRNQPEGKYFPMFRDKLHAMLNISGRQDVSPLPFFIHNIELTNRCPLKCVMCPRTHHMTREQGLMTFDLFRNIIDQLVATNPARAATEEVWLHHFGESLVHPEFGRFARYARERNVHTAMSVNPIMLTPKIAQELHDAELGKVYLSMDGHDDESFEQIRGLPNAYEKSKENALRFAEMKMKSGSRTQLVLSMVYFELNKTSIESMVDFWSKTPGISAVLHKGFTTWDGSAEEINSMREHAWNNDARRERVGFAACNKPWSKMTVTWDGDVVPCCFDYDKKYVLGNANTQTLAEIWNGEPMRSLRREFMANHVANSLCANCENLYSPPLEWA